MIYRINTKHLYQAFLGLILIVFGSACSADEKASQRSDRQTYRPVPQQAARLLVEAKEAFNRQMYYKALDLTTKAARAAPRSADLSSVYFLRGRVLTQTGRYENAREAYREVLAWRPHFTGLQLQIGYSYYREGKYRRALAHYRRESQWQRSAVVLDQIGRVYAEVGKPDSAQWAYRRAIDADTRYAPAYDHLSQLMENLGQQKQALEHSRRALQVDPANINYHYRVGRLLARTGKRKAALEHLTLVIDRQPWHYGAHNQLGQVYVRTGKRRQADRHLAMADSMQSLQHAIDQARLSVNMNPTQPEHWKKLGNVLRKAGRHKEALAVYRRVLKLVPNDSKIQELVVWLETK